MSQRNQNKWRNSTEEANLAKETSKTSPEQTNTYAAATWKTAQDNAWTSIFTRSCTVWQQEVVAGAPNAWTKSNSKPSEETRATAEKGDAQQKTELQDIVKKNLGQLHCGQLSRRELTALKNLCTLLTTSPGNHSLIAQFCKEDCQRCVTFMRIVLPKTNEHETEKVREERQELQKNLQLHSARVVFCITTIGSAEQIQFVVDRGAIEAYVDLLPEHEHFAQLAVNAFGNMLEKLPPIRNIVIRKGVIPPLVDLVTSAVLPTRLVEDIAYVFAELCRLRIPCPPKDKIIFCLPAVIKMLWMTDEEVLAQASSALSSLCYTTSDKVFEEIAKSGLVARLVQLLGSENEDVVGSCLSALVFIIADSELHATSLIVTKVAPCLEKLLKSKNPAILEYAAKAVKMISIYGHLEIVSAGCLPLLVDVLNTENRDAREHAIFTLMYIASQDKDLLFYLCGSKAISAMCDLLNDDDRSSRVVALSSLADVLNYTTKPRKASDVTRAIEECGGLNVLTEMSQNSQNQASNIVTKYFPDVIVKMKNLSI